MKASEKLLNLENRMLKVGKNINGKVYVHYESCDVKDGCFLIGAYGTGNNFEEACEDYLNKISGKTIVFNAESSNREEVKVL